MKLFALLVAALLALPAHAQTTVAPGGAIYDNTTGVFLGFTNRITGAEERLGRRATGAAPTCSANCGTSPTVVGSDTAMLVTMGASGVPASAWVVTFSAAWRSAPACSVTSALASMVVGKQAIAVVTTTTTLTVTTNGTAPATSDAYMILCGGVS
jgi:hypothetical protein